MSVRVDLLEGARIALTSLRSNRMRTVLTTVGIGIGVCTLLAIVGIIQGLNKSFADQLATIGANTVYISKFPWVHRGGWWEFRNRKDLTLAHLDALRNESDKIAAIAPTTSTPADVSFLDRQLSSVQIQGTTADWVEVSGFEITSGRFLTDADDSNTKAVAVLGADVADALFPRLDPVGHSITIGEKPFRVIGTLSRKGKLLGESQDLQVVIPFQTFLGWFGKRRPMSIGIALKSSENIPAAVDELSAILRRARGTPPEKEDDFAINRPEMLANAYNELTGALYGVAVGIGLITLLVGGIGIMNIMLVSVRERTREIGIRRALGARKRTIVLQFLMEAIAVSAVGGALGTVVGLSTAKLLSLVTELAASVNPITIVAGVGFAATVGLLFGIWPAARAANLDPVEALRHE